MQTIALPELPVPVGPCGPSSHRTIVRQSTESNIRDVHRPRNSGISWNRKEYTYVVPFEVPVALERSIGVIFSIIHPNEGKNTPSFVVV
jgi:hypothetical protein